MDAIDTAITKKPRDRYEAMLERHVADAQRAVDRAKFEHKAALLALRKYRKSKVEVG